MGLTSKLEKLKLKDHDHEKPSESPVNASGADSDDIDEMDNEGQSILMGIIAQLRPGMDLSKITLPTFILEKKSMLERITNFFQIPDLLIDANHTQDPLLRFVNVLRWYLASWHIAPKAVKKPLNPVLGETFTCYWDNLPEGAGSAYYISEQTSHHPPKSSYFYLVPDEKIRVDGTVIPKSRFLGNSSAAIMEGWGQVTLGQWGNEQYVMDQPNVYVRGILFGKMKTELGDHMVVRCEASGIEADIEFKTKGFISGTYDAIEGYIKDTATSEELYHITGKWNDIIEIKDLKTGKKDVLIDTHKTIRVKPKVRPLEEQSAYESRRLWKPTIDALAKRDHETATEEKFKVENEQRTMAKKRVEEGVEFHPKFFRLVDNNESNLKDLEYIIYKNIDLAESPKQLTEDVLSIAPFLPGQVFDEKFEIPAFKKQ
ncbi:OSH6 [Candida pseudojiufengensis]|uniref:OSH6 n=1 Tax=Candida pseudojiufengensis TaxID=497109 RepID=UPI002225971B|nr:OSH6 [Candida pseudojiufengensis]KAI5964168.1 OSH6 [Candida pseudojiufengensis]